MSYKYCLVFWPRVAWYIIQPSMILCLSLFPSLCDMNSNKLRIASLPLGLAYLLSLVLLFIFNVCTQAITIINETPNITLLRRWVHFCPYSSDWFLKVFPFFFKKKKENYKCILTTSVYWKCPKVFVKLSFYGINLSSFMSYTSFSLQIAWPFWKIAVGHTCEEVNYYLISYLFLYFTTVRLFLCYSVEMC